MRVDRIKQLLMPYPSRATIDKQVKSVFEEHCLAIPKRTSYNDRKMYKQDTESSLPHFRMRHLERKRAEKYPTLIELNLIRTTRR